LFQVGLGLLKKFLDDICDYIIRHIFTSVNLCEHI